MKKPPQLRTTGRPLALSIALVASFLIPLHASAEEADKPTVIPDTPAAIHLAIDKETNEMSKLIQAGTVKDLHHHAFAVRDLVAALPDKSTSLAADKLANVKGANKFVSTLAERLDTAGDTNDKAGAEKSFAKLQDVLKSVWVNYSEPQGAAPQATTGTPATVTTK